MRVQVHEVNQLELVFEFLLNVYVRFDRSTLDPAISNYCLLLQQQIEAIILGSAIDKRPNKFAPFANSNQSDWLDIVNRLPSSQVSVAVS
jgi:hypothetical protein